MPQLRTMQGLSSQRQVTPSQAKLRGANSSLRDMQQQLAPVARFELSLVGYSRARYTISEVGGETKQAPQQVGRRCLPSGRSRTGMQVARMCLYLLHGGTLSKPFTEGRSRAQASTAFMLQQPLHLSQRCRRPWTGHQDNVRIPKQTAYPPPIVTS